LPEDSKFWGSDFAGVRVRLHVVDALLMSTLTENIYNNYGSFVFIHLININGLIVLQPSCFGTCLLALA
jgi:hypothetical protein